MKGLVETGVVSFVNAALDQEDLEVAVAEGSGEENLSEYDTVIIALIEDAPHVVGGLGHAELKMIISTPCVEGYKSIHDGWTKFITKLFAPAIAPNLPVNAAHISEHIATATDDIYTSPGFHKLGIESATIEEGRWLDNIRLKLALYENNPNPLESTGDIVV